MYEEDYTGGSKGLLIGTCIAVLIAIFVIVAFGGFLDEDSETKKETLVEEDKTSPSVNIINPKENDLLEGKVKILVEVIDEDSDIQISFYINDNIINSGYKNYFNWDTSLEDDGGYTIKVVAVDSSGNQNIDSINIKTDNTPNEKPEIIIESPTSGQVVNGNVEIEGQAFDDVKIEQVEIKIGSEWNIVDDITGDWEHWSYYWKTEGEGLKEIRIKAIDDEGDEIEEKITVFVDNVPPEIEITSPENNALINGDIEIVHQITDKSEIEFFEIYLDFHLVDSGVSDSFKLNTMDYDDGIHKIIISATDIVGNYETSTINIEIDNTPPNLEIENPEENTFISGTIIIETVTNDYNDMDEVEFFIDEEFVEKGDEFSWDTTIYSDGEHEIKTKVQDILGNKIEKTVTVNVDNTAPTIELLEPASQSWVNDMIKIETEVIDEGSGIEYISFYVDGLEEQNRTIESYTFYTEKFNQGDHEILILTSDKMGNLNTLPLMLKIDNSPPSFYISQPINNEFVYDIINIQVTNIFDNESGADFSESISFFFDDDLLIKTQPEINNIAEIEIDTNDYEDGEHDIKVEIIDRLGNKKEDSIEIEIDNTPPYIDITTFKGGELISGIFDMELDVFDDGSGIDEVEFYFDGEIKSIQSGDYNFEWETYLDDDGEHELRFIAYDNLGNYNDAKVTVFVDNTPPEIEFITPRVNSKVHDLVTIEVDVNDDNKIEFIEFFIDDVSVQKDDLKTYDWDTTNYDEGEQIIKIISQDELGNEKQESIKVIVDNLNPMHVDIIEPHSNEALRKTIRINVEVETGEGADVDYITFYIDDNIKRNSTQTKYNWDTNKVNNGMHQIKVKAGDTDGNINEDVIDVLVDNKKPDITIINPNNDDIVKGIINIDLNADDEHSGIEYINFLIDDASVQNDTETSYEMDTNSYSDGEHEIFVKISDKAGNQNQATINIIIDNTAPEVEILNPTSEWVKGSVNINLDIVEDGSGIDYIDFKIKGESKQNSTNENYEWDTTKYSDGVEYDIEITVADNVDNTNKAIKIVGIDNTPPSLSITKPTSSEPYVKGEFRIETDASDGGSGLDNLSFNIDDDEKQISTKNWYLWNTTLYADGEHEVKVQVWDKVGNTRTRIVDAFVDNTLPSVLITYPSDNDELEDNKDEHIDATASDAQSGLKDVEFYIDHILKFTDDSGPYRFDFNTGDYTNGWYDFDVYSYDRAGNRAEQTIRVKIGDVDEPIIQDPHTNYLANGYNVGNAERINVNDYSQIPIISSIIKRGITPSIGWDGSANPKDTFDVPSADQYSKYSGKMALAYWNNPEKAIVVDNYVHALLMSQYAAVKDYPIIVYQGNKQMTDEALYKLDTVWSNQIIVCGNTPYNTQGVSVIDENDIQQFTIEAAKFEGYDLDYITVVNPNDSSGNTAYLSSFGGAYAAFHNGIIIACDANGNQMNTKIHNAIDLLEANEIVTKHICIVGDHISLPMIYESHGGGNTPSDNRYADTDGNVVTIEISIGRVFGKELLDMSTYLDRVINYADYHDNSIIRLQRLLDPFGWRNNAVIYMGIAAEFAEDSENHCREYMWAMGQFNTQDDTGDAHMVNTPKLMADFAMSNYIVINADHGMPTGTVTFSSSDLPDLHPGISFGVSCSVGRVDGVNKQNSLTYSFLEKGIMAWLAPTRTAYGSFIQTYPYQPIAAPGLCWLYLRELIDNDLSSGEAYMNAKNRLISEGIGGNTDELTTWQYQHYGDPAFNPYEPNNEGM